MCCWSKWTYELTMNRISGAINRHRANDHIRPLKDLGLEIIIEKREIRPEFPVARERLAAPCREMDGIELQTTVIDIVAR
jgi:hypothetical protein